MTPREELLQIQKIISDNLKQEIKTYQAKQSPSFRKYLKEYAREFKGYKTIINKTALINKILKSDIVYIGDYHTLNQSQKTVIKILREVVGKRSNITMGLEMVYSEHQRHLDDFMEGRITEKKFLDDIGYYSNWGFHWSNYKPIFDFAKINKIKLLGLNRSIDGETDILSGRDEYAAKIIFNETKENPQNLMLVLYGDLHMADKHLPKHTLKLLKEVNLKRRYIILFQNSEDLYWKLADEGKEQTADVVKISPKKFCILNTPPWIKLQSYLNCLEKGGELLFSPKGTWSDEDEPVDYFHQVSNMISAISSFLDIIAKGLDQFHVYTTEEVEFVDFMNSYMKSRENVSLKEIEQIRSEVIYEGICLIPEKNAIYLSNLSINRVAEKASQFIAYNVSKYYPKLEREGDKDFFYSKILLETIGYIGSKIINFKRKSDRVKDYKKLLIETKGKRLKGRLKDQRIIAKLVVEHKRYERKLIKKKDLSGIRYKKSIYHQSARIFLGLTKALGFIIGNKLFSALMSGDIDKIYLKKLFSFKPKKKGDPFKKYIEIVSLVRKIKERYKSKSERF